MSDRLLITNVDTEPGCYDMVYCTLNPPSLQMIKDQWLGSPPFKVRFETLENHVLICSILEQALEEKWGMSLTDVWTFYYEGREIEHPSKEELITWLKENQNDSR